MEHKSDVLIAVVGAPHGIRGECRVSSFTDEPLELGAYGPLHDAHGNRFTVLSARPQKNVVVVKFAEIRDRTAAERLNGRELFIDRALLPDLPEPDEFYLQDLVGLEAVDPAGESLGRVVAGHNFGAGDILELQPATGRTVMIPFSQAAVPELDLEAGRIVVDPRAAGLVAERAEGTQDGPD